MTITDEMLGAYADGALDADTQAAVERALTEDAELRRRLDAHRHLKDALSARYDPVAEEPVPERLRALISPGAEVADFAAAQERRAARRTLFRWPHYGAMAASLALGLIAGQLVFIGGAPVGMDEGTMVARAGLARALDTQLASTPGGDTRIGLTFADGEGRICRTFDRPDLSGIACREGEQWLMAVAAAPTGTGGEYRQAAAPAVLAQAQELSLIHI